MAMSKDRFHLHGQRKTMMNERRKVPTTLNIMPEAIEMLKIFIKYSTPSYVKFYVGENHWFGKENSSHLDVPKDFKDYH